MLINLLLGLLAMVSCLLLQSVLMVPAIHFYVRHDTELDSPLFTESLTVISRVMLILVIGILGQIAIWAVLFMLLDEFEQFRTAFYHSTVNFATLGYGDIVMSEQHRLLGALEAVNGVIMIGVSTALFATAFQDMLRRIIRPRTGR